MIFGSGKWELLPRRRFGDPAWPSDMDFVTRKHSDHEKGLHLRMYFMYGLCAEFNRSRIFKNFTLASTRDKIHITMYVHVELMYFLIGR